MKVHTTRFGEVEVPEEKALSFPSGVPGFSQLTRWCLLHSDGVESVNWLQSMEDPDVALIIVDPEAFFEGYDVEVQAEELAPIGVDPGLKEVSPSIAVRVVLSMSPDGQLTANLRAPVLINLSSGLGMQLPLSRGGYPIRQPLPARAPHAEPSRARGEARV